MYARQSQLAGRNRLRGLLGEHDKAGAEMARHRERFARLADDSSAPRAVSSFNLFQTPEPLALRMAEKLGNRRRVLEPSAGLGRLYAALRCYSDAAAVLVDVSEECTRELRAMADERTEIITGDFFGQSSDALGLFDGVLMNPPFKRGIDISHILHARTMLHEGGKLVALCANGPKQERELQPIADTWEELPAGLFDGTKVQAVLLTMSA